MAQFSLPAISPDITVVAFQSDSVGEFDGVWPGEFLDACIDCERNRASSGVQHVGRIATIGCFGVEDR